MYGMAVEQTAGGRRRDGFLIKKSLSRLGCFTCTDKARAKKQEEEPEGEEKKEERWLRVEQWNRGLTGLPVLEVTIQVRKERVGDGGRSEASRGGMAYYQGTTLRTPWLQVRSVSWERGGGKNSRSLKDSIQKFTPYGLGGIESRRVPDLGER
jgi:hypothetical protein